MSGSRYDCVVIGGGHNGLVCAAYLARGGRSVLVVEAASEVGGAAVTREFAPGFRVSACAHLLHSMSGAMIKDLGLEGHGLTFAGRGLPTFALSAGGEALALGETLRAGIGGTGVPNRGRSAAESIYMSADAAAYPAYVSLLNRLAGALRPMLETVPPRLGTDSWADKRALLQLGWQIRSLGRQDMRELLRIGAMNVYDLLKDNFESPPARH